MRTTLVTGGAGFIGSHLVESLLETGRHVVVIDDLSTGSLDNLAKVRNDPNLEVVVDCITKEKRMAALIEQADEIYHLAAVVGVKLILDEPQRTVAVNNGATEMILRHAAAGHKQLFLASTSEVYGKNPKSPLSEDDDSVLGPTSKGRWVYACGKALDDFLALSYHHRNNLPVVIGRFFNTVGPRQIGHYGMVVPKFVEQALNGGPLKVHGDGLQVRCFGHVQDVVRGILGLMNNPEARGRVYNLGNDQPITIRKLAERVVQFVNPQLAIEHIPHAQVYNNEFEDIRRRIPDLNRIRTTIGYRPRHNLDDIIRDVVSWMTRNRKSKRASAETLVAV